jgi:protein MBA1
MPLRLLKQFDRGDMSPVSRFCLSPVLRSFQDRIAARGPLTMEWQLTKTPSMRIVSHRASLFGEDQPDTAYRQAVIRIVSTQKLTVKPSVVAMGTSSSVSKSVNRTRSRKSIEESREVDGDTASPESTQPRKVVEYFVLQRRVIKGQEEDWKIWGFTQASTPAKIEDDEAYWRKTLNSQAAGA